MKTNFFEDQERDECFNLDHVEHVRKDIKLDTIQVKISFTSGKHIQYIGQEAKVFLNAWNVYTGKDYTHS